MTLTNILLSYFFALSFLVSCTTVSPPNWINNPPKNTAIGISGEHINGFNSQLELATHRGRVEYSKRFGIKIQNTLKNTQGSNNHQNWGQSISNSTETLPPTIIKASVQSQWYYQPTKTLYVLVGK